MSTRQSQIPSPHAIICLLQFSQVFSMRIFFLFFFNIYLFIWLPQVLVAACGIFSCSMWTLRCGMLAFSCSMWILVPWPGIEPGPPALGAWSLNCWTIREVPSMRIFKGIKELKESSKECSPQTYRFYSTFVATLSHFIYMCFVYMYFISTEPYNCMCQTSWHCAPTASAHHSQR